MVLLASMVAFQVCNMLGIRMSLIPLVMVIGYVIQKLLYHLCIISARYIVDAIPPSFLISVKKCVSKKAQSLAYSPTSNCEEVQKKRMELFHYEYQREQQQYQWQKEREEDEKLNAILRYTRDTFKRFDLDETEIFQICESVRYFVTNRRVLSATEIHIKKHTSLTQISLKNFAWNIAFQYNWKSHSTLTLLATQDLPTFLYYMIDPLKSWCWGAILFYPFYPFKNSRFS